jgi:hypothetical protein
MGFCPQAVEWGDVATWVGAIATAVAAFFVWRIANRDRIDRVELQKNSERKAASIVYPDVVDAIYFLYRLRELRAPIIVVSGQQAEAVEHIAKVERAKLVEHRFGSITSLPGASDLPAEIFAELKDCERKFRNHQDGFRVNGASTQLPPQATLNKMAEPAKELLMGILPIAMQLDPIITGHITLRWQGYYLED